MLLLLLMQSTMAQNTTCNSYISVAFERFNGKTFIQKYIPSDTTVIQYEHCYTVDPILFWTGSAADNYCQLTTCQLYDSSGTQFTTEPNAYGMWLAGTPPRVHYKSFGVNPHVSSASPPHNVRNQMLTVKVQDTQNQWSSFSFNQRIFDISYCNDAALLLKSLQSHSQPVPTYYYRLDQGGWLEQYGKTPNDLIYDQGLSYYCPPDVFTITGGASYFYLRNNDNYMIQILNLNFNDATVLGLTKNTYYTNHV